MTNAQERARAVYEQLGNSVAVCGQGVDILKMQDADIAVIAAALAQVEVETLEAAANHWDTIAEGPWKDGDLFESAICVANWCRQQAQRAKEGT